MDMLFPLNHYTRSLFLGGSMHAYTPARTHTHTHTTHARTDTHRHAPGSYWLPPSHFQTWVNPFSLPFYGLSSFISLPSDSAPAQLFPTLSLESLHYFSKPLAVGVGCERKEPPSRLSQPGRASVHPSWGSLLPQQPSCLLPKAPLQAPKQRCPESMSALFSFELWLTLFLWVLPGIPSPSVFFS